MNLLDLYVKIGVESKDAEAGIKRTDANSKGLINTLSKMSAESGTLKNKISVLSEQYDAAQKKVLSLSDAFNKSVRENGAASKEAAELADALKEAETKAESLKKEMDSLSEKTKKTGGSFSDLGEKLKTGLATAGKAAAAGVTLVTGAATAAAVALLALEQSTEEYRIAQGKLNTAFEAAGYSAETAKGVYEDFYGILGDTDTATEASQLLAKLALNAEDMSTWTNIAAGVWGTFGDSLPIEGLIESANETAKVGLG